MIAPSSYFPATFDLSNGPVQTVETSETDPRVVYDRNGFRATDVNGALLFNLDAIAGSASFSGHVVASGLDLPTASLPGGGRPAVGSRLDWLRPADKKLMTELYGVDQGGGGSYAVIDSQNPDTLAANADPQDIAWITFIARATAGAAGASQVLASARDFAGGIQRTAAITIIDSLGNSDFPLKSKMSSAIAVFHPLNDVGAAVATANFTLPWPALCYFYCNASGYDSSGGRSAAYDVLLDGGVVAHGSHFFNPANTHMQLGASSFEANLATGNHSIQIQAGFNLSRDNNDRNNCLIIALRNG